MRETDIQFDGRSSIIETELNEQLYTLYFLGANNPYETLYISENGYVYHKDTKYKIISKNGKDVISFIHELSAGE